MTEHDCGCNPDPKRNPIEADRLFFYQGTDQLSYWNLCELLYETIQHYSEIGISFKKAEVVTGNDFPEFSGLDAMLFFIDHSPSCTPAQFRPHSLQWHLMQKQVNRGGTPYNSETIKRHTGFVAINDCISLYENYLRNEKSSFADLSPQERVKYFASIATHEIGHSFCALDISVREEITDPRIAQHFMAGPYLGVPQHFYTGNVDKMKGFIDLARANLSLNIPEHRDRLLMGEHEQGNTINL